MCALITQKTKKKTSYTAFIQTYKKYLETYKKMNVAELEPTLFWTVSKRRERQIPVFILF